MAIKSGKELFLTMLSNVWHANERAVKIYQELGDVAQDPQIKGVMEAREFMVHKIHDTLQECFRRLGEKPLPVNTRLQEVFAEDFKRELSVIEGPVARRIYVLSAVNYLMHLHIGQYMALVAAADLSGNYSVGLLLEMCLADKLAFAERTRRAIRRIAEEKIGERVAA